MKIQFIDCEMLCWEDGGCPLDQTKHIIQIGLVEVETENLSTIRKKSYYIRPQDRNFIISDYCTQLTGITRSQLIDEGRYLSDVMRSIKKDWAPQNKITYAWGSDFDPISDHCIKYNCINPWQTTGIIDFGFFFRSAYNHKHKMSLTDALISLGLEFDGKPHDAVNDANAVAILHNKMILDLRNIQKNTNMGL